LFAIAPQRLNFITEMKLPIIVSIIAASFAVTSVMAEEVTPTSIPAVSADQASVIEQVFKDVKAAPENAAEIVKKAILSSKADSLMVAQIMRVAMLQAPGQARSIYNAVVAVAPDATGMVNLMLAAMLNGDEVAGEDSTVAKDGDKDPKEELPEVFNDSTDVSVDDYNKNAKVLVPQEVLKKWTDATGGKSVEVKMDDFSYFMNFGAAPPPTSNLPGNQVVIVKPDSGTIPPP